MNITRIALAKFEDPGWDPRYLAEVRAAGRLEGEALFIPTGTLNEIKLRYGRPRGAGDRVARVAQPIARAIDTAFGTKIKTCGGCAKRQAALNQLAPSKTL